MPYPLRRIEPPSSTESWLAVRVGDCWYNPEALQEEPHDGTGSIGKKYFNANAHRAPIVVCLPNGSHFVVDTRAYNHDGGGYYGDGWTVTGDISSDPPTLHLEPSVNIVGFWHGYIHSGVVTDDLDGRAEAHRQKWAEN